MMAIPPISVSVSSPRSACILDSDLVFSPLGLMLVMRLRDAFDVWLPPGVWRILDDAELILSRAKAVLKDRPKAATQKDGFWRLMAHEEVFAQWNRARTETDLAGLNLYWMGDERSESLLPQGTDPGIVHRFQSLSRSLEVRPSLRGEVHGESPHSSSNTVGYAADALGARTGSDPMQYLELLLHESYRDSVCLAAALVLQKGFVLTVCSSDPVGDRGGEAEPEICRYLRHWRVDIERHALSIFETGMLLPTLAGAGIMPVMRYAAGVRRHLALIHIVAPAAVLIPVDRDLDEGFDKEVPLPHFNWWQGSKAFWYPLSF